MLGNCFIGPHFTERHSRTVYYRSFLEYKVLSYLQNVLLATKDESEYKIKYFPFFGHRFQCAYTKIITESDRKWCNGVMPRLVTQPKHIKFLPIRFHKSTEDHNGKHDTRQWKV